MSTERGKKAEEVATSYLQSKGYKILATNWRRPNCEIDIVASRKTKKGIFKSEKLIHFVEVKYRSQARQGTGIDYITPQKLRQMKFAAAMWVSENNWDGSYELGAIEVTGEDYEVTFFLPNIEV